MGEGKLSVAGTQKLSRSWARRQSRGKAVRCTGAEAQRRKIARSLGAPGSFFEKPREIGEMEDKRGIGEGRMIAQCTLLRSSPFILRTVTFKTLKSKRTDGFISTFSKYLVEGEGGGREWRQRGQL